MTEENEGGATRRMKSWTPSTATTPSPQNAISSTEDWS